LGGSLTKVEAADKVTDIDIINFALNLEYLEAEYYSVATTGMTLQELGILSSSDVTGPTTGGRKIKIGYDKIAWMAAALTKDEQTHVVFLRTVLGSAAVKKPAINLDALGYGFADVAEFFKITRQFEDVGVSAYLGAAPLITSKTYLAAAAAIMATEAQHSGSIRIKCINLGIVSPAVDSLDVPPTEQSVYDVDSNSLSIPRTTSQVLNVVYAGGNCSGGFYPDGMNGVIVCQS
jgi:Ferritin-like domain